jgi:hypothetical protein
MLDVTIGMAFVVGFVQVAKMSGLKRRFIPAFTLIISVALFYLMGTGELTERVFQGLIAGFSAMGLWSGTKATVIPSEDFIPEQG